MKIPQKINYVVVDNAYSEGYVFAHDHDGKAFTDETAQDFARVRNSERKPEYQTYAVYALSYRPPYLDLLNVMHAMTKGPMS